MSILPIDTHVHAKTHSPPREGRRFIRPTTSPFLYPRPVPGFKVGSAWIPSPIAENRRTLGDEGAARFQ